MAAVAAQAAVAAAEVEVDAVDVEAVRRMAPLRRVPVALLRLRHLKPLRPRAGVRPLQREDAVRPRRALIGRTDSSNMTFRTPS